MLQNLLPPCLRTKDANLQLVGISIAPSLIYYVQMVLLHFIHPNISHIGSSILFRIGIDSVQNVHHGGWLAAFQFLSGNRFSVCLPKKQTILESSIGLFNCIVSITGWSILSIVALFGYLRICWARTDVRWLLVPLLRVFLAFLLVFQQSYAVHLQGYSFIFSIVFAVGITDLLSRASNKVRISSAATIVIGGPLVSAIIVSAMRVSYFTDVYGKHSFLKSPGLLQEQDTVFLLDRSIMVV